MSSEIAIKVENLSKCYQIYEKPEHRLMQMLWRGKKKFGREFWALKDISFEIKKGETVGIIGRNGSGKSTLLQMICGTLNPTNGTITTNGRIAALLELGSGFNPEFTGRENIYMNARVLGLSAREINVRYDDIVAFADIGDFVNQPVKTYSSGMMVRLAFAVQSQVSPDILIVDEALAVGDAKFQAKCFERLKQLKESGTSILLVTHSCEQIVTHCSTALLLENGNVFKEGKPLDVVNNYMDLLFGKTTTDSQALALISNVPTEDKILPTTIKNKYELSESNDLFCSRANYNPHEYRWGDGLAKILDFYLEADNKPYPSFINVGEKIKLIISVKFLSKIIRPILGVTIKTKEGITVYGTNSEMQNIVQLSNHWEDGAVIRCEAQFQCSFAAGDYFISLGVSSKQQESIIPHDRRYDSIHFQVRPCSLFFGLVDVNLTLSVQEHII